MKVLTVVVTHNRSKLLDRCLDAINKQSDPTQDLLVINNGSTDDTEELLTKKNIWFITQENVGSAGGWHSGIKIGLEKGYDACWLMDDDGYPHEQALKNLKLNFKQFYFQYRKFLIFTTFGLSLPMIIEGAIELIILDEEARAKLQHNLAAYNAFEFIFCYLMPTIF